MIDLKKILIDRLKQKKLAHFYILEANSNISSRDLFLENWIYEFFKDAFDLKSKTSVLNCPDILMIGPPQDEKGNLRNYLINNDEINDFSDFFKFLDFGKFNLPHKFIVIYNAELLTERISNELLKSFEEPGLDTTIFLLNPRPAPLLKTIRSRGITLKLSSQKTETRISSDLPIEDLIKQNFQAIEEPLLKFLNGSIDLSSALDTLKDYENDLLKLYIQKNQNNETDYLKKDQFLHNMMFFSKSSAFNNSKSERLERILLHLKD